MANEKSREEVIPKLPYGQGTINIMPDGETYIYKKSVFSETQSLYFIRLQ